VKFIDETTIQVSSGDGGPGMVSFRREPYVPMGGPDGGDGGDGASVYAVGTRELSTLLDFRYRRFYKGPHGKRGGPGNKTGARGEDLILRVPLGTVLTDTATGTVLADIVEIGKPLLIAKGGLGGRGNSKFMSSTNRAPKHAQPGLPGTVIELKLTLKLIADVGLVGFPNAGKSTLLARTTHATPKIADYPFTTLTPNLGVAEIFDRTFVIADIPGIIEGASEGAGLGLKFLRHIERAKCFLFLIDASDTIQTPLAAYKTLAGELESFHPGITTTHPSIVAFNKKDAIEYADAETKKKLKRALKSAHTALTKRGVEVFEISALTGENVEKLLGRLLAAIDIQKSGGTP